MLVIGIVLGSCLFILYMADLEDKVEECDVNVHTLADDTALYNIVIMT